MCDVTDPGGRKETFRITGALVGGTAGAMIGGVPGAALGVVLSESWAKLFENISNERFEKLGFAVKDAAALMGVDEEQLAQELDSEEGRIFIPSLINQTLNAKSDRKIKILARAIAQVANPNVKKNAEFVALTNALEVIEEPHVIVLQYLHKNGTRYQGVDDYDLAALFDDGVRYLYSLTSTLNSVGMAGQKHSKLDDPDAPREWVIWDFGIRFLELLDEPPVDGSEDE